MLTPPTNLHIYNTRPGERGAQLSKELTQLGYRVFSLPVQVLSPLEVPASTLDHIRKQKSAWVFVSPTAVGCFLKSIQINELELSYKPMLYAVGHGTAEQLRRYFPTDQIKFPLVGHGSEALIKSIDNKLEHTHYFIFRAKSGSNTLYNYLIDRKKTVENIICYQRQTEKEIEKGVLFEQFQDDFPDVIIITNFESLRLLEQYYTNALWLKRALITVTSERMHHWAKENSFKKSVLLTALDNPAIIKQLNQALELISGD